MEGMGRRRIRDNIWIMDFIIKQKRKRKKRRERRIWGGDIQMRWNQKNKIINLYIRLS